MPTDFTRRDFLAGAAAAATAAAATSSLFARQGGPALTPPAAGGAFALPPLGYAFDALEPNIDAKTMEIHHDKHHQAYVTNLNKLVASNAPIAGLALEALLANNLAAVPDAIKTGVRNNAGGHHNHTLFWELLNPAEKPAEPVGALAEALTATFGSADKFQTELSAAATTRFGSGWAWLISKDGKLSITSTANQDSPIMDGAYPIIGLDVWEHAYYLKYQNRRAEYIAAFWKVLNWKVANDRFARVAK